MPINDFIQFHFGWLNAWIPSFALVLIQLLYMILYREGGKRAVDTSWYFREHCFWCRSLSLSA